MAMELFGCALDASKKLSRRRTTLDHQGRKFWSSLEDYDLPHSHKRRREAAAPEPPSIDDLFDEESGITSKQRQRIQDNREAALRKKRKLLDESSAAASSSTANAEARPPERQRDTSKLAEDNRNKAMLCRMRKRQLEETKAAKSAREKRQKENPSDRCATPAPVTSEDQRHDEACTNPSPRVKL